MKTWSVALAQVQPKLGDIEGNEAKLLRFVSEARAAGAELVVFPELSLTGYGLKDDVSWLAMPADAPPVQRMVAASSAIDIVFSFYERGPDYVPYIAAAYASKGSLVHVHRKLYTPTYGLFDEGRFVGAGGRLCAFDTGIVRTGILICEDAWHLSSAYVLSADGAACIVVPSAAPAKGPFAGGTLESLRQWHSLLQLQAKLYQVFVLYVNRVGFEFGVGFAGGSCAVAPDGSILACAGWADEELVLCTLNEDVLRRARYIMPCSRDERMELVLRELNRIHTARAAAR
ncbi:MAG: acyltransferase [Alicyclobacillus sp.]|nr:acyltransferase [Alicyclobacillus sp.]